MYEEFYKVSPGSERMVIQAGNYNVHAMANIVPLDKDVSSLAKSIERTGLLHPLLMYKGAIIDGRRRAIACASINVVPMTNDIGLESELSDSEIYDIVLAENNRRNIIKSQKAMVAAMQVESGSHKMMGIPNAVNYAKEVWDISKVTYEKAKFILVYGRIFAEQIFETGYADVNGVNMSMSKVFDMLKAEREADKEKAGSPEWAEAYRIAGIAIAGLRGIEVNAAQNIINKKIGEAK